MISSCQSWPVASYDTGCDDPVDSGIVSRIDNRKVTAQARRGGMAVAYRARDQLLDRDVAFQRSLGENQEANGKLSARVW